MRHELGRPYSTGIQNTILNIGTNLDELMASSTELLVQADYDASFQIAELNSRLVNEVIIVSDQISDEEAQRRLQAIKDEIFQLYVLFRQEGIPVRAAQPVPTTEAIAVLTKAHAEELLSRFETAWDLYPTLVDRFEKVRPIAETVGALPVAGAVIGGLLAGVNQNLVALDQEVFFVNEAIPALRDLIAESGEGVNIARGTFVRFENWIGTVFATDEALKRLEGMTERKPATPTVKKAVVIPAWLIGVGIVAVIGAVALVAGSGGK